MTPASVNWPQFTFTFLCLMITNLLSLHKMNNSIDGANNFMAILLIQNILKPWETTSQNVKLSFKIFQQFLHTILQHIFGKAIKIQLHVSRNRLLWKQNLFHLHQQNVWQVLSLLHTRKTSSWWWFSM